MHARHLDYGIISKDKTKDVEDAMKIHRAKVSAFQDLHERAAIKLKEGNKAVIINPEGGTLLWYF